MERSALPDSPIRFGTDGWRAVIARDFTFANVARVARATAAHWSPEPPTGPRRRVVIGFDRRFLSDAFAAAAAEEFAAAGFEVLLADQPTPTPAVSLAVVRHRAAGGVMITASHNPPEFNGYKLKLATGAPAGPEVCAAVEALLERGGKRSATPLSAAPVEPKAPSSLRSAGALQNIRRLDLRTPHLRRVRELVDLAALRRARLRVAHDAMHGVGAGCFEVLLAGTGVRLTPLRASHDCLFGGVAPEPIAKNYAATSAWLAKHPHDLCLVTDGDADRLGAMDGRGRPLSTHQVICLLLDHLVRNRGQRGRVVTALTTTSMVPKLCAEFGLPHTEVSVGFKHTAAELAKGDVLLGAEESGGIGFAGHIPERDGLLAGMILLEAVAAAGTSINRMIAGLERRFGPHRYARLDARFPLERRAELMARLAASPPARLLASPVERVQTFDGVKYTARDGSWLAFRGSGTEPVLRIYAEADSDVKAARLIKAGEKMARPA